LDLFSHCFLNPLQPPELLTLDSPENSCQISISVEVPTDDVTGRVGHLQEKRLNVFQVTNSIHSEDRKAIPFSFVLVLRGYP